MSTLADLIRIVNLLGAGWLLVWAVEINRVRRSESDPRGGAYLAASWGVLLVAVAVGNAFSLHWGLRLTPAAPIVTVAIGLGVAAQYQALKRSGEDVDG